MSDRRDLDALVAEKVMGLRPCPHWHSIGPRYGVMHDKFPCEGTVERDGVPHYGTRCYPEGSPPAYSTDISAAWEVVDKLVPVMLFEWLHVRSSHRKDGVARWQAAFGENGAGAPAPTAPLSICLAALRAVGVALPATPAANGKP